MQHLLAWSSGGAAAKVAFDMAPVVDAQIQIQNSHFLFQQDMYLLWAAAMGATITKCRLVTPSTRLVSSPYIRPLTGAAIPGNPQQVANYLLHPFTLRGREETQMLLDSTAAAGEQDTVIALVADSPPTPAPQGQVFTFLGTSTTAAVANAWTQLTMTWIDILPDGIYTVIGLEHQSANAQAARISFDNQFFRPGTLSQPSLVGQQDMDVFRVNRFVMGQFRQTRMPIVEVLCNGADAAHNVWLSMVKTG